MRSDFVVFILSHGRANNVVTVDTLKKYGYTGKYYIVCDDEDSQLADYKKRFGDDNVLVFSKSAVDFDIMDNFPGNKVVVYARNAVLEFAKKLGVKYFWELEDDYYDFQYRPIEYDEDTGCEKLAYYRITDLDSVIDAFLKFLDNSGALCVAMAQTGDLLGGIQGDVANVPIKRKAMNALFCRTDRPFQFVGRMNDDVNTYLSLGNVGGLFLHITNVALRQEPTQKAKSGNTDSYKLYGTYVKSFYSVMIRPDACRIKMMRSHHPRLHHKINWNNAVPKIISEDFKK